MMAASGAWPSFTRAVLMPLVTLPDRVSPVTNRLFPSFRICNASLCGMGPSVVVRTESPLTEGGTLQSEASNSA